MAGWTSILNRGTLDTDLGKRLVALDEAFTGVGGMSLFLVAQPDAFFTGGTQFTPLYTAQEVATFKSAYADFEALHQIYLGNATLAVAKDFRGSAKQIWGTGRQ